MQEKLGLSEKTVIKAFKQLADVNLISEKRQGLGKPNLIYVGKIIHEESVKQEKVQIKSCKKYSSVIVNNTTLDKEKLHTINTNNNKNKLINFDTINPKSSNDTQLKEIKDKCKLEEFTKDKKLILEDVIDTLYHKDTLKVGKVTVNHFKILEKLQLIVKENLIQLLEILKNTPNIQNAKNYLMICLYNNLGNNNIYRKTPKNTSSDNENCEQFYDDWKFLFANSQG